MRKDRLDGAGIAMLLGVQGLLAFNQVIIKLVNEGLQPVFFAGLRSLLAVGFVWAWLVWKGRSPRLKREVLGPGILIGTLFAAEFLFLFIALDLTVRDYAFSDNPSGADFNADLAVTSDDSRFIHHLFFGAGLSIFFPTKVKRTN